jgi:hypothetical protein
MRESVFLKLVALCGACALAVPAGAQVTKVDPNLPSPAAAQPQAPQASQQAPQSAPDSRPAPAWESAAQPAAPAPTAPAPMDPNGTPVPPAEPAAPGFIPAPAPAPAGQTAFQRAHAEITNQTVSRKDVFTAAEGVFGKGANGVADMIEKLLKDQGQPTAYITGREAGGAFVVGLRYGSGTLHHQIEGDRPVHWTGPSVGFDFGADANKVFVLVYNLHDTQRIFRRFPAAEGNAYVVGGVTASYLRSGDMVLIPVRMGVGARLGVNAGYMKFSEKTKWLPF